MKPTGGHRRYKRTKTVNLSYWSCGYHCSKKAGVKERIDHVAPLDSSLGQNF